MNFLIFNIDNNNNNSYILYNYILYKHNFYKFKSLYDYTSIICNTKGLLELTYTSMCMLYIYVYLEFNPYIFC